MTMSCRGVAALVLTLCSLITSTQAAPAILDTQKRDVNLLWKYGQDKIRGVNIGGWLVTEPWITPSLYENTGNEEIIDEWTFTQLQDRAKASAALKHHWDTWITEDDFRQIAAAKLNHVRIPIGYWAFDVKEGEPYIQGQEEYLDRAIGWAGKYRLKVMIDLHAAPGSQNGYDNSGRRGEANWANDPNNVDRTKAVVRKLSQKYSAPQYNQVVTSLELLNEPATYLNDNLLNVDRQYSVDAYHTARNPGGSPSRLALVVSDGFKPPAEWKGVLDPPEFEGVLLDHHHYQIFQDAEVAYDWNTRYKETCALGNELDQSPLWLVVGEWTLASTDCAKYLNGRGVGTRYEGTHEGSSYHGSCKGMTGPASSFSTDFKEGMRKYWEVQTQTFEKHAQGWIFWCWKNEGADEWSYQAGIQGGWIPTDATSHTFDLSSVC